MRKSLNFSTQHERIYAGGEFEKRKNKKSLIREPTKNPIVWPGKWGLRKLTFGHDDEFGWPHIKCRIAGWP